MVVVMAPLLVPHVVPVAVVVTTNAGREDTVVVDDFVQPLASVTVTVYVPAKRLLLDGPMTLLDHWYDKLPEPPDPVANADPLLLPLQAGLADAVTLRAGGAVRVVVAVEVLPPASVTVTVDVPAGRVLFWAVVTPFDQL